ncbi:MAG: alkaline phosphatase family protein [Propionibacteriaceae bacterium]|jgi:hypothetical protein|nr:alkaline phosphatase family protein [Propionibacteriaceae bacterium]
MAIVKTHAVSRGGRLDQLLPSLASSLLPGDGTKPSIALSSGEDYVVYLVDGLGWEQLLAARLDAPFLASLMGQGQVLTSGLPSTTVSSLMSLWTGLPSGQHGLLGYSFHLPGLAEPIQPLSMPQPLPAPVPLTDAWIAAGIVVSWLLPPSHVGSAMTRMGAGNARLIEARLDDDAERMGALARASDGQRRSYIYAHDRRLDHAGHRFGVASVEWNRQLSRIDSFLDGLRRHLPDSTRLLVTADHGLVEARPQDQIELDEQTSLHGLISQVAGEPRFRHLYSPHPQRLRAVMEDLIGDRSLVLERDQAIAQGVFGPVDPVYQSRIGDVVVIAQSATGLLSRQNPGEYQLRGAHGGATSAERLVPLLQA